VAVRKEIFTSESVTEGHPDKMADQISDGVLDAVMAEDPQGRVACEVLVTTGLCVVAGEITTSTYVDVPRIARGVIKSIGYTDAAYGFDAETCGVISTIQSQSPDIAMGVDPGGAGDQGLMFGFACDETPELMPLPIMLAHQLVAKLSDVRRKGVLDYLRPDGKSQVSVEYHDGKPVRLDAVVVSTQHGEDVSTQQLRAEIKKYVIDPVLPKGMVDAGTKYHINPTGRFVVGGPSRRHRVDRTQDHRRHLRRHGEARRRLLLGQGSNEGGPLGLLYGALRGQEHRRRRSGAPMRGAVGLRHRRGRADLDPTSTRSAPAGSRGENRGGRARDVRTCARARSSRRSTSSARSTATRRLRPLWPRELRLHWEEHAARRCLRPEAGRLQGRREGLRSEFLFGSSMLSLLLIDRVWGN
jgi:hypothetical protein